jgi:hypothetical protein
MPLAVGDLDGPHVAVDRFDEHDCGVVAARCISGHAVAIFLKRPDLSPRVAGFSAFPP